MPWKFEIYGISLYIHNFIKRWYWRNLRSEAAFGNWKSFKHDEKWFYLILKTQDIQKLKIFVLKIFKLLSWFPGFVKRLD